MKTLFTKDHYILFTISEYNVKHCGYSIRDILADATILGTHDINGQSLWMVSVDLSKSESLIYEMTDETAFASHWRVLSHIEAAFYTTKRTQ